MGLGGTGLVRFGKRGIEFDTKMFLIKPPLDIVMTHAKLAQRSSEHLQYFGISIGRYKIPCVQCKLRYDM